MFVASHCAIGLAFAVAGWFMARILVGALSCRPMAAFGLDAAVPGGLFAVLAATTARPISAGLAVLAACGSFAVADRVKRAVLREPVIFPDFYQLRELVRHPRMFLGFESGGRSAAVAVVTWAFLVLAFAWEPRVVPWPGLPWIGLGAIILAMAALAGGYLTKTMTRRSRRLAPSGELVRDARRFGPFATLVLHAVVAREERPGRRAAVRPGAVLVAKPSARRPPIVLVQSESFFDAGRLPVLPPDLLPVLQGIRRASLQWGRLAVPAWGANTPRTEFAVLTGIAETALGLDRFNPYYAFARAPVDSLAWALKSRGYRTVCVHPFDRTFYGRHRIMPALGFDRFFGGEAFRDAERIGGFVSDHAVADFCRVLLDEHSDGPIFVFAITMENHAPWPVVSGTQEFADRFRDLPRGREFGRYLRSLRNADAMIASLTRTLVRDGRSGILGFYGDHLPSFPTAFNRLGFGETSTDYVLWRPDAVAPRRLDLAAHELPVALLDGLSMPIAHRAVSGRERVRSR